MIILFRDSYIGVFSFGEIVCGPPRLSMILIFSTYVIIFLFNQVFKKIHYF